MNSILTSIKKMLGISEEYNIFDADIVMHINSVFMTLTQLRVGPAEGFEIQDELATWDEFLETYEKMIRKFGTYDQKRIIIYVHNLAFEFQFMRKLFQWQDVFSLDTHKPLYAVTYDGVEFRCSY